LSITSKTQDSSCDEANKPEDLPEKILKIKPAEDGIQPYHPLDAGSGPACTGCTQR